jgi:hypothetical protein
MDLEAQQTQTPFNPNYKPLEKPLIDESRYNRREQQIAQQNDTLVDIQAPERDFRFRQLLERQLGPFGLQLLTGQTFVFVIALILIIVIVVGSLVMTLKAPPTTNFTMDEPYIVYM